MKNRFAAVAVTAMLALGIASPAMADCDVSKDADGKGATIHMKSNTCLVFDAKTSAVCNGMTQIAVDPKGAWNNSVSFIRASHGDVIDLYRWGDGKKGVMYNMRTSSQQNLADKKDSAGVGVDNQASAVVCRRAK